jgi:membrane protein
LAVEVLQELQRARHHIHKGLRVSQLAQLLGVDVLQLAPVLDALTALDWVGRTSDPAHSAADEPEPRYVLLADPEKTLLEPLLQRLLLDRADSLEPLWDSAGLAQLHLSDVLQK